jgi:dienelactone hydrolase
MKLCLLISLACFVSFFQAAVGSQGARVSGGGISAHREQVASANLPEPKVVTFPGPENITLHGFLYIPEGKGPFPAMIWNHGSEPRPGWQPELGQFYASKGFVFFIPHRHGQGRSADAGPFHRDLQKKCKSQDCVIGLHDLYNKDVVAAVSWLKQQAFVDKDKIVMSGVSFGGIQTLLTAERGFGIRAFVAFAPAAMSWNSFPDLRARLLRAEREAREPIFLIQAQGDYNTEPYELLGAYLIRKGGLNRARLYARFGNSNQDAHAVFATKAAGIAVWQTDVLSFIDAVLKQARR